MAKNERVKVVMTRNGLVQEVKKKIATIFIDRGEAVPYSGQAEAKHKGEFKEKLRQEQRDARGTRDDRYQRAADGRAFQY